MECEHQMKITCKTQRTSTLNMILQRLFDVIQGACPMSIGSSEPGDVRILGSMDADVVSAAKINDASLDVIGQR